MADVRVGKGDLAGRGVYADRDFLAGEAVITFELQGIDEAQYLALPTSDDMFVHSYGVAATCTPAGEVRQPRRRPLLLRGLRPVLRRRIARHR